MRRHRAVIAAAAVVVGAFTACSGCSEDQNSNASTDGVGTDGADGAAEGKDAGMLTEAGAPGDAALDGAGPSKPKGTLFGFVGSSDGKVRVYTVDVTTGSWAMKKESSAGTNPSFLAFDPSRARIVAVDEMANQGRVRSFAFDGATGALSPINDVSSGGAGPTHLSLDPKGAWVMVANYTGGSMAIFPIDAAGQLGAASDTKASGEKSHWAGTDPSGTHVFVPALGANAVAQYNLDGATGKLADNGKASLPAGAGPRHLAFAADEKHAYVVNELATSVTTFDYDKSSGKLTAKQTISALPPGTSTSGVSGAEIVIHPNGKYVYASTRGYDSIATFAIGADGTLTRTANAMTGGSRPRSFGIDPEGTLLFAGNETQNVVVGFKIDATTGALTSLGKTVDVTGPTFVGLARFP